MSKKSDLWVRTRTALIFAVVVVGSIVLHFGTYLALMALVMALSLNEYFNIIKLRMADSRMQGKYKSYAISKALACFGISALVALNYIPYPFMLLIPLVPFGFMLLELFGASDQPFRNIGYNVLGWVYLVTPFLMLNLLVLNPTDYLYQVVLGILFLIWANDSFAYLIGRQIGRTKLFERISPGKTIEGTAGGVLGAMLVGVALHYLFALAFLQWWDWVIIAALASIFATLGDLCESMLKRSLGIKDSGNILPGHGGMLDRFDAFFFAVPFVTAYLMLRIAF